MRNIHIINDPQRSNSAVSSESVNRGLLFARGSRDPSGAVHTPHIGLHSLMMYDVCLEL